LSLFYRWYFPFVWWSWLAYWIVSSFGVLKAKRALPAPGRLRLVAEMVVAWWLMSAGGLSRTWLGTPLLPYSEALYWIGAAVTTAGLGFSVWARVHLGKYWSGNVTLKEGHRLIRSGPYALVRHPIYTGLILGFLGSAIAIDQLRGVIAVAIVIFSFIRKLHIEEKWLTEEFGEEYLQYKREVRALF
jgi:protein-S-isoprenylcysteine O-methyltransferase Ste14